ncbi:uncharacterized protein [Nothobranchius furzeri]|uniref:uncharacterized protein n=1 Tax=Nothobranchius furzeri TaxID=105023 RepID=UPI003904AA4D
MKLQVFLQCLTDEQNDLWIQEKIQLRAKKSGDVFGMFRRQVHNICVSWSEVFPCCHSLSFEFSLCRWACLEVTKLQQICSSAGQGYLSSWETPTLRWMITLPGSTSTFIPDWLFLWNSTCLSLSCSLARTTSSCPPKLPGSPPTQLPPRLPFWISVSGIPSQPRPDHSSLELLFPLSRLFPARAPFVTELSYVQAAPLLILYVVAVMTRDISGLKSRYHGILQPSSASRQPTPVTFGSTKRVSLKRVK